MCVWKKSLSGKFFASGGRVIGCLSGAVLVGESWTVAEVYFIVNRCGGTWSAVNR